MRTFICVDKATGKRAGTWGPSENDPPSGNDVHAFVDQADYPDFTPHDVLDLATGILTKNAAPRPLKRLSKFEFMSLLTIQERIALRTASGTDPVLGDALKLLEFADHMQPERPFVVQMMGYIESLGVLTPERRAEVMAAAVANAV